MQGSRGAACAGTFVIARPACHHKTVQQAGDTAALARLTWRLPQPTLLLQPLLPLLRLADTQLHPPSTSSCPAHPSAAHPPSQPAPCIQGPLPGGRGCVACCVSPLHPWTPRLVAAPDHVFALPTSFKVISHPCGTLPRPAPAPSLKWLLQLQSSSSWKTTGATAASTMCFRLLKSIISCAANGHSRA